MADEKTEEKTKQTVPALERTAKGIAAHAAAVQDRQWDKERKVFKDPVIAMLALFTYAKLTAAILDEAEARITKERITFEKRIAEFETRLTTLEKWRAEVEAMTGEMVKNAEAIMADGPEAFLGKLRSALPPQPVIAEVKHLPPKIVKTEAVHESNGEKKDDVA